MHSVHGSTLALSFTIQRMGPSSPNFHSASRMGYLWAMLDRYLPTPCSIAAKPWPSSLTFHVMDTDTFPLAPNELHSQNKAKTTGFRQQSDSNPTA